LPMAFVGSVWQIVVLRLCLGATDAAMMPGIQTLLTRNTPKDVTSRIFSFNQSAQAMGMVGGPIVGAVVGGLLDYRYVFFATMALAFVNLMNVIRVSRKKPVVKA